MVFAKLVTRCIYLLLSSLLLFFISPLFVSARLWQLGFTTYSLLTNRILQLHNGACTHRLFKSYFSESGVVVISFHHFFSSFFFLSIYIYKYLRTYYYFCKKNGVFSAFLARNVYHLGDVISCILFLLRVGGLLWNYNSCISRNGAIKLIRKMKSNSDLCKICFLYK